MSGFPGCGIIQDFAHDQTHATHDTRIEFEGGEYEFHIGARRQQSAAGYFALGARQNVWAGQTQHTTQHHQTWIKRIEQTGNADAQVTPHLV